MKGHSIVVTGSSRGIGKAICELLMSKGATVIGLSRSRGEFHPEKDRFRWYNCDLADLDNLPAIFDRILLDFPKIDGFISSAGFGHF